METKRKVMVIVPVKVGESMESITKKQNEAEEIYNRRLTENGGYSNETEFVSTVGMIVNDDIMASSGYKFPRLKNIANGMECLMSCDEVLFGMQFHNMKYGRILLHICNEYGIPSMQIYKKTSKFGERRNKIKNPKIEQVVIVD